VAVAQFLFFRVLQFSPLRIIPPTLHTHSFIYHWQHIIFDTDSVVKQHTPANDRNLTPVI
jgi:hypothetical protein